MSKSQLEKRMEGREQAKSIHEIVIDNKLHFIADGYSRSKHYGLQVKRIPHHVKNKVEAWELWKDLIGYNLYSTEEEKREKLVFIAENAKRIFQISKEGMVTSLSNLLGLSKRTVQRYIPDQYKDTAKRNKRMTTGCRHKIKSNIKELEEENRILRAKSSKPSLTASTEELIEVLYSRLEEQGFPELDSTSFTWLKFLFKEYITRKESREV